MLEFNPLSVSLPQALASALRRLAHLAHTSSWDQWAVQRLTPTQRRILDVVASRRESLTLSALARELGVTPATASDSVGALESKGLVQKRRSDVDGRALALMLTSEGQSSVTALAALPDPLQNAFGALTAAEQEIFYRSAIKMIRGLQETGALPVSRMCVRCRHFGAVPGRGARERFARCRVFLEVRPQRLRRGRGVLLPRARSRLGD